MRDDLPAALQQEVAGPGRSSQTLALDLQQPLDAMIEQITSAVIAAEGGNRTRAAQRLGISIRTIQRHSAARATAGRKPG